MKNDELIIKLDAIRSGDTMAFEELYDDLKTPIYTIVYRIIWDKTASEDIMQEVFVKLYLSPPKPSIKNPRAYIFQMARNLAIDNTRKHRQHISLDEMDNTTHQPSIAHQLSDNFHNKIDIENALKAIPAQECQIVTLHIIGELKFREIAEVMQIPLGTVLWKYQKALGKLKRIISGEDEPCRN